MGGANERLGRLQEARDDYLAALRIDPDFAVAHNSLALLAILTGHMDDGLIHIREAIALDPGNPNNRQILAILWDVLGSAEQADRAIPGIESVDPSGLLSAWASAFIYANRGDLPAALIQAQKVFALNPDDQTMLSILGFSDLDAGHPEIAVSRFEDALPALADAQDPVVDINNYGAAINLAYLLQATGQTERANRLLERALAVTETMPRMGPNGYGSADVKIFALQGQKERALAALRLAVDEGWLLIFGLDRELESLHEEPEYQAIVAEIDAKLTAQRERALQMDANGELAPLPD